MGKMRSNVHGNISLNISVPVDANSETLALLEANFNYAIQRIIGYGKIIMTDINGNPLHVEIHDIVKLELDEFIE